MKNYIIIKTRHRDDREYKSSPGNVDELVKSYSYTLECGKSYEHETGNKKININPKSIKSLVTQLNNAVNNSAANGYGGCSFEYEIFIERSA